MKMKRSSIINGLIGLLLLVLGGIIGFRYGSTGQLPFNLKLPLLNSWANRSAMSQLARVSGSLQAPSDKKVDFDVFWEAWSLLESDYLEPEKIDAQKMVDGAIYGMTQSLGDPYTTYLAPVDLQRSEEDLSGSFYGVGIELGYIDGTLAVVAPLKDSPAEQAGVKAGDLILHVRDDSQGLDEDTLGWTLTEAVDKIRGERRTPVVLTLWREDNGREPFEVSINRDEIVVESVELTWIQQAGKEVAHVRLSRFGERTLSEWNQAVQDIATHQPKADGIVLDMRNNPGGFFDRSIEIASDFFKKGVVVSQQSKFAKQDFQAQGAARLENYPLVVLVNRGSASAAEIVAGALRDERSAKLVGEKTFGKGTVQDRRELSNGGGMHITIGRWLLPDGGWIHEEGIPVDVEVKDDPETEQDEMLEKAVEEVIK